MLSSIVLLLLAFVAGSWFLSFVFGSLRSSDSSRRPPGPLGLPIIGSLLMLGDLPHRALQKLSNKYGSIMHIRLGLVPITVISSAESAELFLKAHDLVFSSRKGVDAYKYVSYGGKGLVFAQYGPYWRNIKKLCTIHLLSNAKTEMFKPVRSQEVVHFIEAVKTAADSHSQIDVTAMVGSVIEGMSYRLIFGFKDDRPDLRSSIEEAIMLTGVFNITDYIPFLGALDLQGVARRMKNISKVIDGYLEDAIDEHIKEASSLQGQRRDFIDVMVSLMMDSKDAEENRLDRDNIKAIILDMLGAGMDTTATVIVWTVAELLANPHAMRLVQEELENVVGLDRMVEETDLDKLEYLKMVIKESMRLHPVVPLIPRQSIEDITVHGYFLPKKSRILINTWAIGRDPDAWSSNADEFYPERFAGTKIDVLGRDFQFLPFGTGRRRCPGLQLAITVVEIVVSQLVHCFNLELPKGMSPGDLDMNEKFGLTMPRSHHLLAIPTHRLQKHSH